MVRRLRRSDDEKIMVYFGIDPNAHEVRRVWLTRGYALSMELPDGTSVSHQVEKGRHPPVEIATVWRLTQVFGVPAVAADHEATKARIKALEDRAAEIKSDALAGRRSR